MASVKIAEHRVLGVRRTAPNLVTRIEIPDYNRNTFLLEEGFNFLAQEWADILELHVPGGITSRGIRLEQILPGAFGDGDHRVGLLHNSVFECGEKALQLERDFGNESEINVLVCHSRAGRNEPGVTTHQSDQPNPVRDAARLSMGTLQDTISFLERTNKSEGA